MNLDEFWKLLHPRFTVVIGSGKFGEKINFMTASWITPIDEDLPCLGVAIYKKHYTFELVEKYKQFSVNILPANKIDLIFTLGCYTGRKIDKVKKLGLKIEKGRKLNLPILKECIGFIECKVYDFKDIEETRFYFGKVEYVEAKNEFFDESWKNVKLLFHVNSNKFLTNDEKLLKARKLI